MSRGPRHFFCELTEHPKEPTLRDAAMRVVAWSLVALLSPLLAAIVMVALLAYGVSAVALHVLLWLLWSPLGKRVLVVYSNSPVWQIYFEEQILPRLPSNAVVLNWSDRRHWRRWSLAYFTFRFFGGDREFNPLAVVVRPFRWSKTFRF